MDGNQVSFKAQYGRAAFSQEPPSDLVEQVTQVGFTGATGMMDLIEFVHGK